MKEVKTYKHKLMNNEGLFIQKSERFDYRDVKHESLVIRFDGACTPRNPNGDMGYGWTISNEDDIIAEGWGYYLFNKDYETSNNVAEWVAVYFGCKYLTESKIAYKNLTIIGDSQFVINQANGYWRVNKGKPYSYFAETFLRDVMPCLKKRTKFKWERRDKNDYCDMLSNKFLEVTKQK